MSATSCCYSPRSVSYWLSMKNRVLGSLRRVRTTVSLVVAAPNEGGDVESPVIVSNGMEGELPMRRCAALCHQTLLCG